MGSLQNACTRMHMKCPHNMANLQNACTQVIISICQDVFSIYGEFGGDYLKIGFTIGDLNEGIQDADACTQDIRMQYTLR